MFNFFRQNNLFTKYQSGFSPGDYGYQLPMKLTKVLTAAQREMLGEVFLNISKAFDKVWHEGLQLQSYGVEGNLLRLLKDYLTGRQQRVALNGQTSL